MRTGVLRCGYAPWPVYFDVDPNTKKLTGLNKELSDATARILGLKVEYVETSFSNKVIDLKSGKIDAMCGDGPWILTSLRAQNYTRQFYYADVYLYGRHDENRFKKTEDLNAKDVTFVGIDGDLSVELVQFNFENAKLNSLPTITDPGQMLMDIATKKADVTILDPATADAFMASNPNKVQKLFDNGLAVYGVSFGVAKGETELLQTLDAAVEAALNTGITERILLKYDPQKTKFRWPAKAYN